MATTARSRPLMSLEAWADLPEDMPGELVDGRLVEDEMNDCLHEVIVGWFIALFRAWIVPRGGLVVSSGVKFGVAPLRGRVADVSVYFPGHIPPPHGLVRDPPDVLVEVVSPRPRDGRRDRVEKPREYAAFGVRYYWIVDPQLRSLEVLELVRGRRYAHAVAASDGVVRDVPGCEDLSVDLDALWAETDRLGPAPAPPRRARGRSRSSRG